MNISSRSTIKGELRLLGRIGYNRALAAQFYQPLGPGNPGLSRPFESGASRLTIQTGRKIARYSLQTNKAIDTPFGYWQEIKGEFQVGVRGQVAEAAQPYLKSQVA